MMHETWPDPAYGMAGDLPSFRSLGRFVWEGAEGVVLVVFVLLSWPISGRWLRNWGSTPSERRLSWHGDEFVEAPEEVMTRAVDIQAPPESVWPWVAQFGLGRAGFYSYELLERLVGIPVRNVESIVPSLQEVHVGDGVRLHPKSPPIPVAAVETGQRLCFAHVDGDAEPPDPARSWSLYLTAAEGGGSRLIVRTCLGPVRRRSIVKRLALAAEVPIDFLMEQRMLRTIRRLSEKKRAAGLARGGGND